jgi:hypothetical protein
VAAPVPGGVDAAEFAALKAEVAELRAIVERLARDLGPRG